MTVSTCSCGRRVRLTRWTSCRHGGRRILVCLACRRGQVAGVVVDERAAAALYLGVVLQELRRIRFVSPAVAGVRRVWDGVPSGRRVHPEALELELARAGGEDGRALA